MSKNTQQQEQLEMGNRRSRSPAHEHATQAVAPKPAAGGVNNDTPFVADQLNVERRVVLQLREGCSLKKIHAAFEIFNVAATVASFCPLPPFEIKGELLEAYKDYLLRGKRLSKVDRYALSRVTTVGDSFLEGFYLVRIDLSPLSGVTAVGKYFLCGCDGIKTINLSPLSNVTTVGVCFLYECTGLMKIDLTPLSNVTTVGNYFLRDCSGLSTIDLSPLSNHTTVGDGFLSNCSGLKSVDLSPLSNVTTICHAGVPLLKLKAKISSMVGFSSATGIGFALRQNNNCKTLQFFINMNQKTTTTKKKKKKSFSEYSFLKLSFSFCTSVFFKKVINLYLFIL